MQESSGFGDVVRLVSSSWSADAIFNCDHDCQNVSLGEKNGREEGEERVFSLD